MNQLSVSCLAFALSATLGFAAKNAELKPGLAKPGKSVLEAHFESGGLEKPWTVAKGDWVVQDGAIVGKEKPSDNHAAVLLLALPARDSVIRFSFKLDGATGLALSFNQPKGHLFRVLIGTDSLTAEKDKDKADEASKAEELGKAPAKLPAGEWHTMLVEVKGEQATVQTDDGAKVEVKNSALAVDKTGYRFVVRGASLLLGDVRVWEVAP